jgi:hypothetical protein
MSVKHSVESSSLAEVLDRILEKGIVITCSSVYP